jgi:predicted transcriptional regulator
MLIININRKEKVLSIVKHSPVPNIEQIARSAGLSRVTTKKYLDELVSEDKISEVMCGNSRIYLNKPNNETPLQPADKTQIETSICLPGDV